MWRIEVSHASHAHVNDPYNDLCKLGYLAPWGQLPQVGTLRVFCKDVASIAELPQRHSAAQIAQLNRDVSTDPMLWAIAQGINPLPSGQAGAWGRENSHQGLCSVKVDPHSSLLRAVKQVNADHDVEVESYPDLVASSD